MRLAPGTRLGPYEITAQIGVGGMGEVYRAVDTNLRRDVAIKVLPQTVAQDGERLARFEREARTLAALNHPNIAIIHGLERTDGIQALVMEFVEGPTLADRIAQGPIPAHEALPIARQIAEALQAAHEQGVIHRDLKPANIKLREDGTVKVLDFGLAKTLEPPGALSPNPSSSPTITTPAMTQLGVILGTPAYMSPEQAKGRSADKRSDIWAFGCVLFEMLTGKRVFENEDVTETVASILRNEPAWDTLPGDVPPAVVQLIRQSLEKDRRRRIADTSAALFVLSGPLTSASGKSPGPAKSAARHPALFATAALLAATGIAATAWWIGARTRPIDPRFVTRFSVPLRSDEEFSGFGRKMIGLSPDGRHLAYVANGRINLRSLDRMETAPVRGTEATPSSPGTTREPFFSPNSEWIGFWRDGQIRKIGLQGGASVPIATTSPNATGFTWRADGTILFTEGGKIQRVPAAGGMPQSIVDDVNGSIQSFDFLPGNRAIIFSRFPDGMNTPEIVVRSLETGEQRPLIPGGFDPRYVSTGHLVYFAGGALLAVQFDPEVLNVHGAPVPVAENVAYSPVPGRSVNSVHIAISPNGTLAYIAGSFVDDDRVRSLVWVDRSGREQPVGAPDRPYIYPRLSPDDTRIGLTMRDQGREIYVWHIGRKVLSKLTDDPADDRNSVWTRDGTRIAFGSNRGGEAGTWIQAVDGSGSPTRLAGAPISKFGNLIPTTISPDGSKLVVSATGPAAQGGSDLWIVPITGPQPAPLVETASVERNAEIQPGEGAWIAYESVDSGRPEIHLRSFPDVTRGKWPVSSGGGSQPVWARNGKELFYLDTAGTLMSVRVEGRLAPTLGAPTKVLDASAYVRTLVTYASRHYDVSLDGQRFLMLKPSAQPDKSNAPRSITVVENWFEELKRVLPKN